MVIQEHDEKEKRFILSYNRLKIDIKSYKTAIEIFPNEIYWSDKLQLEEIKEQFTEEELKNDFTQSIKDLSTRYWLTKEDHVHFAHLLKDLDIDQVHLDNIALVVMYYEVYKLDFSIQSRVDLARELKNALDFVRKTKEPGYELLRISVKGGFLSGLNPRTHLDEKPYSFKNPSLMRAMKETFINWTKTSPDYWNTIGKFAFLIDHVQSPASLLKFKQEEIMIWVYDYIADYGLSDNHHNASYLTGKLLLKHVDFLPIEAHYKSKVEEKGTFNSYDDYLSNHMRTAIKRILKERGRTNRFKKENSLC